MGKLIVIEGTDSSGKETQTKKLFERLLAEKYNVKKISGRKIWRRCNESKSLSCINDVCHR